MVALSMCLTPCSPFLLQQQEQWCWDAGTWLGWMVRQGLPHRNRGLTALSLLLFVQLQLGKAQQLPLPSVLPVCWAHLAERCFCHLQFTSTLQLLLGSSWALGKRGARSAPHSLLQ